MIRPTLSRNASQGAMAIGIVLVLISAPELVAWAADWGLVGSPRWRTLMVQYGAFWPGLLQNWQPNFAAQPWTMFLSYSFLHGGILHLLGNALSLLWIGPVITGRMNATGFVLVWTLSALCGAVAFALLTTGTTPMVGASGSVFGLLGAAVVLTYLREGQVWTSVGITLGLVVFNIATLIVEHGFLAWQPHLGGYMTGATIALFWHRPKDRILPG